MLLCSAADSGAVGCVGYSITEHIKSLNIKYRLDITKTTRPREGKSHGNFFFGNFLCNAYSNLVVFRYYTDDI